jgi:outer membrane protein assembly factor BamB
MRRSGLAICAALATLITFGGMTASAAGMSGSTGSVRWAMLGYGPGRNGNNPHESTINLGNVASLRTHWATAFSTNTSFFPGIAQSPIIADGRVFIGTNRGREQAYSFSTGHRSWSVTVGGRPEPTPGAVSNGKLYVGDHRGDIFAINDRTGVILWEFRSGAAFGLESDPAVADGMVFVGIEMAVTPLTATFYALSASTGAVIWSEKAKNELFLEAPTVWQTSVFFGTGDGVMHARVAATGRVLWDTTGDCFGFFSYITPAAGGLLDAGSCAGTDSTLLRLTTPLGSHAGRSHRTALSPGFLPSPMASCISAATRSLGPSPQRSLTLRAAPSSPTCGDPPGSPQRSRAAC